jgi:hypothetical protein
VDGHGDTENGEDEVGLPFDGDESRRHEVAKGELVRIV